MTAGFLREDPSGALVVTNVGAVVPSTIRKWNDDDSQLRVPVVAGTALVADVTVLTLFKPDGTKNAFESLVAGFDSAGVLQWSLGTTSADTPYFYTANGFQTNEPSSGSALTSSSYWLLAYCKQGVAGERVFRICELGGTPQHINGTLAGDASSPATTVGGFLAFGKTDANDDLDALMAVTAVRNTFLSESDFNAIATAHTSAGLVAKAFGGVWDFNQADAADPVPDLAGNHVPISGTITGATDTNGIAGTTIVAGSAPAWTFGA